MKNVTVLKAAVKLFGSAVAALLMCGFMDYPIMVLFAGLFSSEGSYNGIIGGYVVLIPLCLILYCAIAYNIMWRIGFGDVNKVNYGHIREDMFKGLKAGAVAVIPRAVAALLFLLSKTGVIFSSYVKVYKLADTVFLGLYKLIDSIKSTSPDNASWTLTVAVLLSVAVLPLISHFGYVTGYKRVYILKRIVYKKESKE